MRPPGIGVDDRERIVRGSDDPLAVRRPGFRPAVRRRQPALALPVAREEVNTIRAANGDRSAVRGHDGGVAARQAMRTTAVGVGNPNGGVGRLRHVDEDEMALDENCPPPQPAATSAPTVSAAVASGPFTTPPAELARQIARGPQDALTRASDL
jgi:hypothetical protein